VASLGQVPDKARQLLMERFYNNLWNSSLKMSKLDALLEAQRWMLHEGAKQSGLTRGLKFEAGDVAARHFIRPSASLLLGRLCVERRLALTLAP
jgi:CHAT domain-containing protein